MSTTPPAPVLDPPRDPAPTPEPTRAERQVFRVVSALLVPAVVVLASVSAFQWLRTTDANRALVVLVAIAAGTGGVLAVFAVLDRLTDLLRPRQQDHVRPWVFVGPALLLLSTFLLYPAINTIIVSLQDATGSAFVGLDNYRFVFSDPAMVRSIRNTLLWMVIVPAVAVSVGLVFAVLADRLPRGEALAKSMIFLPMAISFVGASVVWSFIYDYRAFGNQTGLLNGIWTGLGNDAVAWLSSGPWNNLLLMVIMIWMQTGFAMVILSAAIKAVPDDILEAARIDGASEVQIFWRVTIPSIRSAIVVVTTTMVINVLKVFDIVYVTTGGRDGTEVIAERMIRWSFAFRDTGRGAAIAALLFVAVVPIMWWNVRQFRAEEAQR